MEERPDYGCQVVPLMLLLLDAEHRRPTKKQIIDGMLAEVTFGRFLGDKRDGKAPPIKIENFTNETIIRCAASGFRARLSRLPRAELWREAVAGAAYIKAQRDDISASYERVQRAEREAHHRRQAHLARRGRLQPDILLAAWHYRDRRLNAKKAWDTICKIPFVADGGNTVEIEGKQWMRVKRRDGTQRRRAIGFEQWRKVYWPAAAKPGPLARCR